jgi:hypothetical protein
MDTKNIYIYTKRRARVGGKSQYVELIPKLFGDLYDDYNNTFIQKKKQEMNPIDYENIENILEYFMKDKSNYINYIQNITKEEIESIKKLNREIVKESFIKKDTNKDAFIEHLFRGHSDMQYGIYFSLQYAENDEEFIGLMNRRTKTTIEDRIIYYTTLDKLVDHVLEIKKEYKFDLAIISIWKNIGLA